MRPEYDKNNVFAKILRGEIPCDKVGESEHALAFNDITPKAPTHILVIPRGAYVDLADFSGHASDAEIVDFMRLVAQVTREAGLAPPEGDGFRAISNAGPHGVQEVMHFHLHIAGGMPLPGLGA